MPHEQAKQFVTEFEETVIYPAVQARLVWKETAKNFRRENEILCSGLAGGKEGI
jgi:hypothetical protein